MSDFPNQPEADAAEEPPAPITGSAPQQGETPDASAIPEGVLDAPDHPQGAD